MSNCFLHNGNVSVQELVYDMLDVRGVNSELSEYLSDVSFLYVRLLWYTALVPGSEQLGQSRATHTRTKSLLWLYFASTVC